MSEDHHAFSTLETVNAFRGSVTSQSVVGIEVDVGIDCRKGACRYHSCRGLHGRYDRATAAHMR